MRSSATKHRDMARSILPSRARSIPAQLASVRRAARRDIARELASLKRHGRAGEWDDWDDTADLCAYPDIEIRLIVRGRRGADKLNHFERWAIEVTKRMPVEDRLGHLRAVLPGGLIGDHAMSHLRNRPELNPHHRRNFTAPGGGYYEILAARRRAEHERIRNLVEAVLEAGGHKALNTAMKAAATESAPHRTLADADDIDAFVSHVLAEDRGQTVNPRRREAVDTVGGPLYR